MHPICPADELAMIRARITEMRNREQELRKALLAAPEDGREGQYARVEVVDRIVRVFDHRLLDRSLRDDPMYWRERTVTEVRCLPVEGAMPARYDMALAPRAGHAVPIGTGAHGAAL